jgi:hypothetical protein
MKLNSYLIQSGPFVFLQKLNKLVDFGDKHQNCNAEEDLKVCWKAWGKKHI